MTEPLELTLHVDERTTVSALLLAPEPLRTAYVFGHGAGAGMRHSFMAQLSEALAHEGVATLRYQFPFMENGSRRPDPPAAAHAAVRAAVSEMRRRLPQAPLFAGGKSYGGRMTSQAQALAAMDGVRGLAFVGFPLHPADKPGIERATHLVDVKVPMLFLQGTRDELADLELLRTALAPLGERATLHVEDDADHSFHVRAKSGRKDAQVLNELARTMAAWFGALSAT
jgi:predicted alpha/beta-hydrolase family hydrolase